MGGFLYIFEYPHAFPPGMGGTCPPPTPKGEISCSLTWDLTAKCPA